MDNKESAKRRVLLVLLLLLLMFVAVYCVRDRGETPKVELQKTVVVPEKMPEIALPTPDMTSSEVERVDPVVHRPKPVVAKKRSENPLPKRASIVPVVRVVSEPVVVVVEKAVSPSVPVVPSSVSSVPLATQSAPAPTTLLSLPAEQIIMPDADLPVAPVVPQPVVSSVIPESSVSLLDEVLVTEKVPAKGSKTIVIMTSLMVPHRILLR